MTTNTVSKFHRNPSRSVKWFLYNSLHIYRESLLNTDKAHFEKKQHIFRLDFEKLKLALSIFEAAG